MHTPTWRQVNVAFPEWQHAETAALAHLAPLLRAPEDDGALTAWFLVRKRPCWRVRYLPTADGHDRISQGLDLLAGKGHIETWSEVVYEPEAHAFGGTPSMATAHRLFHRDSRNIVDLLPGEAAQHRRETSLMLCSLLMRSAEQDWYEQGDIWARVAEHRPLPSDAGSHDRLHAAVHRLITVDTTNLMQQGGTLAHAAAWADAYRDAGRELAHLNDTGRLHRGLRDVLAHHVVFAWNRIGLPYDTQAALAAAAKAVIFGPDLTADGSTVNTDTAGPRGDS
jgi:thiopeptide-type bacteriocin biosynthesis protein